MVAVATMTNANAMPFPVAGEATDQRVILRGISWDQYETLRAALEEQRGLRLAYLDGELEIMSPSRRHEHEKTLIARLIEAYGDELGIDLLGFGSETYRKKAKELALEPDECYCVGTEKDVPDFAIEVVLTSGGLDKLEIYRGLGVPEVWFWVDARFHVFHLGRAGYRRRARSAFLPDLDLDDLAKIVAFTERAAQARAVRAFRARFRRSE